MCTPDCFLFILAVLFPPLPVWVKRGIFSADSIINIALCCLGWFPGLVHAWYIIMKYPDPFEYTLVHDSESGCAHHPHPRRAGAGYRTERMVVTIPAPAVERGYGTVASTTPQPRREEQGPRTPERYTQHPQQTPPESEAGPNVEPPSYASVVSGDHKVQHP